MTSMLVTISTVEGHPKATVVNKYDSLKCIMAICGNKLKCKVDKIIVDQKYILTEQSIKYITNKMRFYCCTSKNSHYYNDYPNLQKDDKKQLIIISDKSPLTRDTIYKFKSLEKIKDLVYAIGYPNLYDGPIVPNGLVFVTSDKSYPEMIDNFGMGISLIDTGIICHRNIKKTQDRLVSKMLMHTFKESEKSDKIIDLDINWDKYLIPSVFLTEETPKLGLLYGKDASIIFYNVDKVYHENIINPDNIFISVKSSINNNDPILAFKNRFVITHDVVTNVMDSEWAETLLISDQTNNSIEKKKDLYYHRKECVSSDNKKILIEGQTTYLIEPKNDAESCGYSIPSNNGRKISHKKAHENFIIKNTIYEDTNGSKNISHNKNKLIENVNDCYKNINSVIKDLEEHNMINIICTLNPLVIYR